MIGPDKYDTEQNFQQSFKDFFKFFYSFLFVITVAVLFAVLLDKFMGEGYTARLITHLASILFGR